MSKSPSFIRTDKAIMHAFIELLKEKSFEKITIQDILDRTPVTRATFYAHYQDKYNIAEKMLEQFLHIRENVREELRGSAPSKMRSTVRHTFLANRDLAEALLKIRTEKIDLRQTIAEEFEQEYLMEASGSFSKIEARIYAQARAELELSHIYNKAVNTTFEHTNELFLNVSLKLLRLSDDPEVKDFINKKLAQKFSLK